MMTKDKQLPSSGTSSTGNSAAIRYVEQAIAAGKHWYIALLEAIGQWQIAEETHHGRTYRYLIAGEAFDWLLLAERLCEAVDGLLPDDERTALLFHGKPPLDLGAEEFKKLIGSSKYHQYLNYFYGITTEQALIETVQEEVRKDRQSLGCNHEDNIVNETYQRIYGTPQTILLKRFRREQGYPQRRSISMSELKEFTYWLFKYRLNRCDKAKVASDTKKALTYLKDNSFPGNLANSTA